MHWLASMHAGLQLLVGKYQALGDWRSKQNADPELQDGPQRFAVADYNLALSIALQK